MAKRTTKKRTTRRKKAPTARKIVKKVLRGGVAKKSTKKSGKKTAKRSGASGRVRRPTGRSSASPEFRYVEFRVHKITCVRSTVEADRDEIVLGAVKGEGKAVLDGNTKKLSAKAEKGSVLDAGKFNHKKQNKRSYSPPKVLARYKAGRTDTSDTKYYVGSMLMIEKDEGAIGTIVNAAVKSVEKELKREVEKAAAKAGATLLTSALGGAAAGSTVPLLGTALGAAAGVATQLALKEIKKARKDDVFPPQFIQLPLRKGRVKKLGEVPDSRKTYTFKAFKGHYKVETSWAVT